MIKHILLFTSALLLSFTLFAQNATEVTYQSVYQMDFNKVLIDNNYYYVGSDAYPSYSVMQPNKLLKVRNTGEIIAETDLPSLESNRILGVYKRGHEIWCVNASMMDCDDPHFLRTRLLRLDTSLNLIENKIIFEINFSSYGFLGRSTQLQNGDIIIASGDSLASIDTNANIVWKSPLQNAFGYYDVDEGINGEIILPRYNHVDVYDTNGSFVNAYPLDYTPILVVPVHPSAYLLFDSNDTVYSVTGNFGPLVQQDLSTHVSNISSAAVFQNKLYVAGKKPGAPDTSTIVLYDNPVSFVSSVDLAETSIKDITLDGDTLIATGWEVAEHTTTATYSVFGGFLKAFDTDLNSHEYQNDGEITEIIIDSSYVSSIGPPTLTELKVRVRVRNNGQENIKRVALSHTDPLPPFACGYTNYYKHFDINLSPGQDTLLEFGWLTHKAYIDSSNTTDVCFLLTSASYLDDDHTNNVLCQPYSIPTSINSPQLTNNLTIYPDPTSSELNISFEMEKETDFAALIYDISGRQVAQLGNQVFASGKHTVSWDASTQPAGLYYCHITLGEETIVKKVSVVK